MSNVQRLASATLQEIFDAATDTLLPIQPISSVHHGNALGETALHLMSFWGEIEAAKRLIAAGADINAKGEWNETPLFDAVMGEHPQMVEFLLISGADRNHVDSQGCTAMDYVDIQKEPEASLMRNLMNGRRT